MPELIGMADRIMVMAGGEVTGMLEGEAIDEREEFLGSWVQARQAPPANAVPLSAPEEAYLDHALHVGTREHLDREGSAAATPNGFRLGNVVARCHCATGPLSAS